MSLATYKKKRDFKITLEPEGKEKHSTQQLIFVVQEHDASHLHYDFRLEMKGVLKSWAVPKGPSMNPKDKRLAMMVEDHPYSYKNFEGSIPEGNYGAGNVIVWDRGTYHDIHSENKKQSETNLLAGLKKGHISFILYGKKLKGEFSLIKLNGKQENAWLLIKKEDEFADEKDILLKDKSVISKKKLILKDRDKKTTHSAKEKSIKSTTKIVDSSIIKPMLATLNPKPFDDKDWIFEIKYDGYRTIAHIDKEVQLKSRNNLSFNKLFYPLLSELKKITHEAVLDGEVVIEDEQGNSNFQLLQNYERTGKGNFKYYVFDILSLDDNDTSQLPLIERKELLKLLLKKQKLKNIFFSDFVGAEGINFFNHAIKEGQEGIVAKNKNGLYHFGKRSSGWLKIKINQTEEAIIAGITEPKGSRKHIGSLILGAYKEKKLHYIGNCGTGFTEQSLKELFLKLKPYFIDVSPFKEKIKLSGKIQWILPKLICQVKFSEWTDGQHMRHPVFTGLRIDKKPNEVILPITVKLSSKQTSENNSNENEKDIKAGKINVHLTNQQKIFFPNEKITKGDIANYYNEISSIILPYLKNRPESMNRFPNGIKGSSFYQKDVNQSKIPDWIKTKKIYSESNKAFINYLICNDKPTLLYMANLGCIEINPWNSKITAIENPDWLVIDLDPEKIKFSEVVRAALVVKNIMDELETECYCKTSGATGLHVFVPLAAKYNYNNIKTVAEVIAQTVFARLPETTSIIRNPQKRQKKVYIDFLQNRKGQTLAAPYSVRPRAGATVSTPLNWNEVNEKLDPTDFTIKTIFKRLDKFGDLWKPMTGKGSNLDKIIKQLSENKS
jgi:bifunctional non-homologous end joining protein LigD